MFSPALVARCGLGFCLGFSAGTVRGEKPRATRPPKGSHTQQRQVKGATEWWLKGELKDALWCSGEGGKLRFWSSTGGPPVIGFHLAPLATEDVSVCLLKTRRELAQTLSHSVNALLVLCGHTPASGQTLHYEQIMNFESIQPLFGGWRFKSSIYFKCRQKEIRNNTNTLPLFSS